MAIPTNPSQVAPMRTDAPASIIPFNKPYLSGNELEYIRQAVESGKISGNGMFTQRCHAFFQEQFAGAKLLLTTSCTDALEMCSLLASIGPGDEVIVPSYTFVSTANPFVLRGANLVFIDSEAHHPNLDAAKIEELITPRTKAIVPMHYAGMACDMERVMEVAARHSLLVIEDAAQAIDAYYKGRRLGSIGHASAFSFHETKNIISGEGGLLVVNEPAWQSRAEVLWEKGTNRAAFFRGEADKYGWVDVGSSFLPSEVVSAFLYAQLEHLARIQARRLKLWEIYHQALAPAEAQGALRRPLVPPFATNNAHMYYILAQSADERTALIAHLKAAGVHAVFHYLSLHASPYFRSRHDGRQLPNADRFSDTLLRLPLFFELSEEQAEYIANSVSAFYGIGN